MSDPNERISCKTCGYWKFNGGAYQCRASAPTADPRRDHQRLGGVFEPVWPTTQPDDYCGDWTDA